MSGDLRQFLDGQSKIDATKLDKNTAGKKTIVSRVEDALAAHGLSFNKGRVAKRIIAELGKKTLSDLDASTVSNFRKVIDAINNLAI